MTEPWWVVPAPRPGARLSLFCFPYAGGSATVYHKLALGLPEVEVASLQLPGRGFRLREPAIERLEDLLPRVEAAIAPRLGRPYALFGHSMGALVAFELARRLVAAGHAPPLHLFASAAPAPRATRALRVSPDLEAPAFWTGVHALYGTPAQVLADPELLALVVPPLKNDFRLVAAYRYHPGPPLATPVTSFYGSRDPIVDRAAAEAWREETTGAFALHEVPGPHLFLQESGEAVLRVLSAALARPTASGS